MFHGFASHTSPSFITSQYSHPQNQHQKRQQKSNNQPSFPFGQNFEAHLDNPSINNINQPGAPIVYTEAHSELGIVQPRTAKKISNAASLNDFGTQRPQTGRVIFDVPKRSQQTVI